MRAAGAGNCCTMRRSMRQVAVGGFRCVAIRPQRRMARVRAAVEPPSSPPPSAPDAGAAGPHAAPPPPPPRAASPLEAGEVPTIGVSGIRMAPRPAARARSPAASLASLSSISSLDDLDALSTQSADFVEQELVPAFEFSKGQVKIIEGLRDEMLGCSWAFFGVALASIALSVAASNGVEVSEAPEVLFSGVTVGDVASWVDSLLVAALLRFGAVSFTSVLDTRHKKKQLAYTFQGINRLGLVFQQLAVAAGTVSFVITLEAAVEWPPLVTVASGLFFTAAVVRSAAMWWVLSRYGKKLDDVEEALEAHRRCVEAAHDRTSPLLDRLAIRVAFNYLLQFEAAGRRAGETALLEGGRIPAAFAPALLPPPAAAPPAPEPPADTATTPRDALRGAGAAAGSVLKHLPSQVLPLISRTGSESDHDEEDHRGEGPDYQLTPEEERLVQAFQSSLNSAGLSLVLQCFATGLLVTASLATDHVGHAIEDGIQVVNKAIAAELIFVATANIDNALYTEGCDVAHLLQGLGGNGLSKLFHNLSILAWAVVLAKLVSLAAPWEENSPFFSYLNEILGHKAGDVVMEAEEILVRLLP